MNHDFDPTERVWRFVEENEPVDQDVVVERFGTKALQDLRALMEANEVTYDLEWNLVVDDRSHRV